ncbi:MAG TPA: FAD-dependent oxidoreductase, partial [Tetrasphaera sp.]|uniref:FAD-dependent oxidoreductase n=1 Tax=Nostocoides sp. TaxID=1917966 RepID=UPI002D0C0AEE
AARALADLCAIAGALPDPLDAHVQRWGGALPQYAVGHMDRIALVRKAIGEIDGLEVAGAAYDGVGIPAVIGSGRRAARAIRTAYGPGD